MILEALWICITQTGIPTTNIVERNTALHELQLLEFRKVEKRFASAACSSLAIEHDTFLEGPSRQNAFDTRIQHDLEHPVIHTRHSYGVQEFV
jgi:hypothetical protein